jgi:hypothetical protein
MSAARLYGFVCGVLAPRVPKAFGLGVDFGGKNQRTVIRYSRYEFNFIGTKFDIIP